MNPHRIFRFTVLETAVFPLNYTPICKNDRTFTYIIKLATLYVVIVFRFRTDWSAYLHTIITTTSLLTGGRRIELLSVGSEPTVIAIIPTAYKTREGFEPSITGLQPAALNQTWLPCHKIKNPVVYTTGL